MLKVTGSDKIAEKPHDWYTSSNAEVVTYRGVRWVGKVRFMGEGMRRTKKKGSDYDDDYYDDVTVGITYLLTYLLTPWSRVLLEKLTGSAASQEIPRIFGTRRFITVLTSARPLSLS